MPTARQSRPAAAGRREIRGSGLSGVSRGVYNAAKPERNFGSKPTMPGPTHSPGEEFAEGGGRLIDFPTQDRPKPPPNNNLPLQLTSFIGREREIADLRKFLTTEAQLVTLSGSRGSGKTRYEMLQTLRQYGREKLEGSGEARGCWPPMPRGSWRWPRRPNRTSGDTDSWSGWDASRPSTTTSGRPCDSCSGRARSGTPCGSRGHCGSSGTFADTRAKGTATPGRCSSVATAYPPLRGPRRSWSGPSRPTAWRTSRTTKGCGSRA